MDDGVIRPLQKGAGRRPQDATGAVPGLTEADRANVAINNRRFVPCAS
jgi:hypothetical protein